MINQINPFIRYAGYSVWKPLHTIRKRIIFDYEIIYVKKGFFPLLVEGKRFSCREGDVILLHPAQTHVFEKCICVVEQPHIHFDLVYDSYSTDIPVTFKTLDELNETEKRWIRKDLLTSISSPIIRIEDKEAFLKDFFEIVDYYDAKATNNPIRMKICMLQIINRIIADNAPELLNETYGFHDVITTVKEFIDANHQSEIILDSLELQFNYSKFYLEKKFKERYGSSIIQYSNNLRLQSAKNLLPHMTVTEVAQRLQYASVYSFSRAFKNKFGYPPTQVKKQDPKA